MSERSEAYGATEPDRSGEAELQLGARLERLQRIVAELEREDIELEDALRLFEEGVRHLRAAEALVARSELLIERLLEQSGGPRLERVEREE